MILFYLNTYICFYNKTKCFLLRYQVFWQMPRETLIIKPRNLSSGNAIAVLRTVNVHLKQNTVFW